MSTTEHGAVRDVGQEPGSPDDGPPETVGPPEPRSSTSGTAAPSTTDTGASTPSSIGRELRLSRATELARAGHRDAADRLLTGLPDPQPSELDLRARIAAQRGDLSAADALWAEAARSSSEADAFRAQRAKVTALQGKRIGTARGWRGAGRALLALLVIALLAGGVAWTVQRADASNRDLADLRAQQDRLTQQLQQGANRPQPDSGLPQDAEARLAGPGVEPLRTGDRIVVRLTDPAFGGGGADLLPDTRDRLADLGRRLVALGPDTQVRVVGHTAPGGDTTGIDGGDLGLQRADVAATALAGAGGPPRDRLEIVSAGSSDPPFGAGSDADIAARNRTVTIEVVSTG